MNFILMVISIILFLVLSLPIFIVQLVYRVITPYVNQSEYFRAIAVGVDALGGSVIYASELHTISGMTGYFSYKDNVWHKYIQAPFIDYMFGEGHCKRVAVEENLIKESK